MTGQRWLKLQRDAILLLAAVGILCHAGSGASLPRRVCPTQTPPAHAPLEIVPLSGHGGIGFDDLRYAPGIARVLAPAGRLGTLELIEPRTLARTSVTGFAGASDRFTGGHDEGVTSADEGHDYLYATDRTSRTLRVIDVRRNAIVASTPLLASPDYVRYAVSTQEVWVTEPEREQIEVFTVGTATQLQPRSVGVIAVPGGPESLEVDQQRGLVFTHRWRGATLAIGVSDRMVRATWPNACKGSRGIAEDLTLGFLFVGCAEGRVALLDVGRGGRLRAVAKVPLGVDVIAYNSRTKHLYVPGATSAEMSVLSVSPAGQLRELARIPTAAGAHCVTSDNDRTFFVCDPGQGRLLVGHDTY